MRVTANASDPYSSLPLCLLRSSPCPSRSFSKTTCRAFSRGGEVEVEAVCGPQLAITRVPDTWHLLHAPLVMAAVIDRTAPPVPVTVT
jgi:hypothetical protein